MKKLILFSLGLMVSVQLFSQYPSAGLLRSTATFAVGKDTWMQGIKPYLYTEFEGMPDDHVGIAGTVILQLANRPMQDYTALPETYYDVFTHHLFFGPAWHFAPGKPFDFNVSFQPGMTLVGGRYSTDLILVRSFEVAPSVSGAATAAYYGSFFHVYAQARIITGKMAGATARTPLTEGLLTFGLGFNLDVKQ